MPRTQTLDALVLQTHDVGEADRFCILFSKERGKVAVRARSVRKPGSRLGSALLPMRRISVQVREGSAGFFVTDALVISAPTKTDIHTFARMEQGIEILLLSLHDEEPLPELFDAAVTFLERCDSDVGHSVLAFTLRMLHLLGLFPSPQEQPEFKRCSQAQITFAVQAMHGDWNDLPKLEKKETAFFSGLCAALLSEAMARPPRAGVIAEALTSPR